MNRRTVTSAPLLLATLLFLLLPSPLQAQANAAKPGRPTWSTPLEIKSGTGKVRLEWKPGTGEAVELYRFTERFNGAEQVAYVDAETLDVYRVNPGEYQFSLEACIKDSSGLPLCGPKSLKSVLIVTDEVWAAYLAEGQPAQPEPIEPGLAIAGGPDDLRPGLWYDPAKAGQAWSIYWANRLAISQNPTNAYDLYVIWYTYEAKRQVSYCDGPDDTCPPIVHEYYDYRPVVATMALAKHQSNSTYAGAIYIKRGETQFNVGSATVTFGENNRLASIAWTATFKKQALLSGTDNIELLAGSSGTSSADVSYLAGLWGDTNATHYIVDNLGSLSEAVEAIFYDDNGDPTWIQAYGNQVPLATDTPLCFYHVQGGYQPDLKQTALQASLYSSCDPDNATSTNRNGRRYFDGHEIGRFWVSFSLPPGAVNSNAVAGGRLDMGSSTVPATLAKSASFHRIWYAGGGSCQISTTVPNCAVSLTWFTDGDYPNATAFAFNQTTAQRTLIKTSSEPAMELQTALLSTAGTYVFELRMSTSSASTLMAQSSPYSVTMVTSSPIAPANPVALWSNETNRNYSVQWSHTDSTNIAYYHLEETSPGGSATVYTVSPGTTLSRAFSRWSGPFGSWSYRVRACNSSAICSNYTAAISWVVTDPNAPPPTTGVQKPWGNNAYGTLTLNQAYNYALGYHFKPAVNGQVTQLGGLFNGVKTVKLFRRDSGALLAQATVSSGNAWGYVPIAPVNLTAGVEYTVAGYLAGSGASYRAGISLPKTYGDITILAGTSIPTATNPQAIPTNNNNTVIYGQVDIGFQSGSAQQAPSISAISDQQNTEGQQINLQVIASDPDGSITAFGHGSSLPAGLSISNTGLISGTLAAGSSVGSPYSVTISASDNQGLTDQETFSWTVDPPGTGGGTTVFSESFEGTLGGQWTQDTQNDWFVSSQRATGGTKSVEVDGFASGAQLISVPIDLQGSAQATVRFNWYIESGLDSGEYLALDVSTNGGTSWTERARVNGNADPENVWRSVQLDLQNLSSLRLRFRGSMSASDEDANIDDVLVTIPASPANTPPLVTSPGNQSNPAGSTITHFAINVTDAENDQITCTFTGLPMALLETSECVVGGTLTAAPGTYAVTVIASDGKMDSQAVSFNWTITPTSVAANPETPPAPASAPGMTPDAASSAVGATPAVFHVDETGSATYSMPIYTAPGSGGMVPRVSLDYSSRGGNGPLGVGWSLGGLSAITRCSRTFEQDGKSGQRGISLTTNDRFCLDGQRLINVTSTEYRTEIDSISKIVAQGSAGSGPQSFIVWRKDGSVGQYGGTSDSRIEARTVSDSQTVLTWVQNRVTDRAGNYVDYVYDEFSGAGGGPVELVLTKILYTGNTAAGTSPYAQLEFIYDSGRADTTVAAVGGAQVVHSRLLKRIDSKSRVHAGSSLLSLRSYHLAYSTSRDGHGRAALVSVTECNDSGKTHCFKPTVFGWQFSEHGIGSSSIGVGSLFNSNHAGLAMADINGDGRPDLMLTEKSGETFFFRTALAQASGGFSSPGSATYSIPATVTPGTPVSLHAIDLNADGFQDLIYPSGADWKAFISKGATLSAAVSITGPCCGLTAPALVRIMDFDGDGLSDLVTQRTSTNAGNELVLLRNTYSPSSPNTVGLAVPQALAIDVSSLNLFPEQSSGGWVIDDGALQFDNPNTSAAAFARPFDYNGDGAVDLLVRLRQRYVQCATGCTLNSGTPTQPKLLQQFDFGTGLAQPEATQQSGSAYSWASFYLVLLSDGGTAFGEAQVVATGDDCLVYDACHPFTHLPSARKALPVDINNDGLADLAWQDELFDWYAKLNTGDGFLPTAISIANFDGTASWQYELSSFLDITGDGLPELVYPNLQDSAAAVWQMHENLHGGAFAPVVQTNAKFGNSLEHDGSILVDTNGDGMLDNLFIDRSAQGEVQSSTSRVYLGQNNVAGGNLAHAMNLVGSITNGFGASTVLSYKPLTDASVYSRMRDGARALWGAGSVVYDLAAPVYVVSQIESSAPLHGSPTAMNRAEFRYVGAKLQGGGRGFLGFGEVISYDPQLGIRTNTRYRQDFPYIGQPADTTKARVSSSQKLDAISNTAATSPVKWAEVVATSVPPVLPSGTLLSYTMNQWAAIETMSGKNTWFLHIASNLERSYTVSGIFDRKVLTTRSYSGHGDLSNEVIKTYATDGSTAFSTQTRANTYLVPNTDNWRLGKLSASSVTHARSGVPSITRQSSFAYDAATGILNSEVVEPNYTSFRVTKGYQLDAFGNRISSSVSGSGFNTRTSYTSYDPFGRFVIETRNAYNQTTQKVVSWDAHGNSLAVDDIEGARTSSAVDYMGRPFISQTVTGAWSKTTQSSASNSYCPSGDTAFHKRITGGGQPSQYRCYDRLEREIRTATEGFDGGMIFVDRYFDASGRLERASEPYFSGATRYWNLTVYDSSGRIDSVLAADGNDMTYDYDQAASACTIGGASRQVKITNGLGQSRLELRNVLGEATTVYDHHCGAVSYSYDASGNPIRVTGADQAVTVSEYDAAGRKTRLVDPDKGTWQYAYNPLGELIRQLDGKNQAIDFVYDLLGRQIERREFSNASGLTPGNGMLLNSEVTTWNNSSAASARGKGQATAVVYRTGSNGPILHQSSHAYDTYGRPALLSTSMDGLSFAEETTYDQFGRVFQHFDASGEDHGVRYHYNSRGYLEKLQEAREGTQGLVYQHVRGLDARGNFTYIVLGNGIEAFASYDGRSGKLSELDAYDAGGNELQNVKYTFDVAGNLLKRHDTSGSNDLDERFTYDLLNRLEAVHLSVGGTVAQNTLSLQYDASGNIKYKTGVGNYSYGSSSSLPHAVNVAGSVTYNYDANGNQVSASDGRTITYTVFDQARRIEKAAESTEFFHGIANQRIKRVDNNAVDELRITWYFGSVERIQQNNGNAFFKRYIGDFAIADFYPVTQEQTVQYPLKDHLGSIHTLVDSSGAAWPMHFSAFGERQAASWNGALSSAAMKFGNMLTSQGFTGHEHADGLGIIHMNGRIYDPRLGRFLQADPLVQEPRNSQSLNRYSYVLNNPLSLADPSGYFSIGGFVKKWWRVAAAVVVSYYTFGAASGWATSWLAGTALAGDAIAIGAIAGGIAGLVGGAIISGSLKGAFQGAAAGVLMGGVAGYFGDTYSLNRLAADTLAGGVSAEVYGQDFKNGLLFGALVSSATYITVKLRAYQKANSEKFPGQVGESEGFRGIDGKVAGERIFEQDWINSGAAEAVAAGEPLDWVIEQIYLPYRGRVSPLGGFQGSDGLIFGQNYQSGGLIDYVLEGYSGVHDTLNQPYFYTANGTNRSLSGFRQKSLGYMLNPTNVLLASPLVLPAMVPDYMRHFYFQELNQ